MMKRKINNNKRRQAPSKTWRKDNFIFSNPSNKWVETQAIATVTNSTPSQAYLTLPSLGTGYNARVGNSIKVEDITLSYSVAPSTAGFNNCRVLVFQQVGPISVFAVGSIFMATATGVVPESQYLPGIFGQYRLMYDKVHDLNTEKNAIETVRVRLKVPESILRFDGNTNTIYSGNLVFCTIAGPGTVGVDVNAQLLLHFAE